MHDRYKNFFLELTASGIPEGSSIRERKKVIEVRNLCKSFGDNHVLVNLDLDLYENENIVVLGKSGSGKSVLIKCIVGLMKPDSGNITIFGEDVLSMDEAEMDKIRSRIGFLFQSNALYDSMTVRENLEFPLRRHHRRTGGNEKEQILEALEDVGLASTIDMMPAELSGGMRKRIALARTLIMKPQIILYDEPTTGLDTITGKEIIELMVDIRSKYHAASLIISHDMNCVRMASDRVFILIDGKEYAGGTYAELIKKEDPNIKAFFE